MLFKKNRRHFDSEQIDKPKKISENKEHILNNLFQWFIVILSGAILGYALITFVFQTVTVVGPSMSPTLKDEEIVIVNKLIYNLDDVKRYDIIAYSLIEEDGYFDIKRVVGMPGEKVTIKDGYVYINDKQLQNSPFNEKLLH